jgi:hypothetical protein
VDFYKLVQHNFGMENIDTKSTSKTTNFLVWVTIFVLVGCICLLFFVFVVQKMSSESAEFSELSQSSNGLLFEIADDAPSLAELGLAPPPSESDTAAYGIWMESYRDAYYMYLVESNQAEFYPELDGPQE